MDSRNEMETFQMKSGIFQYFLLFEPPQKIKFHTPSIALNLHIREWRKRAELTSNFKVQSANVWQFRQKQAGKPIKTTTENVCLKSQKRVTFNNKPSIQHMHVWKFAYEQARKGDWAKTYSDKVHFHSRIDKIDKIISPILEKKLDKMSSVYV